MSSSQIEKQAPQLKYIDDWRHVGEMIRTLTECPRSSSRRSGQGFVCKGSNPIGATITGADPEEQDQVSPVTKDLIAGKYVGLASDEVVIDYELAKT